MTWHSEQTRRGFLEEYAREHGFDPLIPANWYSQSIHDIKDLQVREGKRVTRRGEGEGEEKDANDTTRGPLAC